MNTPRARISTRTPMHTSRIGSILAVRPWTSMVTSRSYMSAISDISSSISPVSSPTATRSEEHTSELQSRLHLVCRLLLEKKKNKSRRTNEDDVNQQHCH